jgi:two-component system response regulator ResD
MASVLIVEDDGAIAALVRDHLVRAGHDVTLASDGDEALTQAEASRPDLVVLDVMLPGRSGLEVCSALRRRPPPQPVVLMLTARQSEDDAVAGFEAGADDYVRKPFGVMELVRRVEALLVLGRRRASAPRLTIGALAIDLDARAVTVRGKPVHLTPKELDLLAHLAQRPGTLIDRETLLGEVWGYRHAGYARTVDSHVTRVRKKLAAAGLAGELITTVHGSGYRFDAGPEAA